MEPILVTGGTSQLGRVVVDLLAAAGRAVHVLSRSATGADGAVGRVVGDLATGAGLAEATAGVGTILHCASRPQAGRAVDVEGTRRLLDAARAQGRPHVVYISIVGIDRIPVSYYRGNGAASAGGAGAGTGRAFPAGH